MLKKHLLIVDDDKRIRELLEQFLKKNDYRVTLAEDSFEARILLSSIEFDLLIIDVMMPGEDGLSLTKYISKTRLTPILLLSARVETSERILGLEMGADDYLSKPFEPRELLLRVEAILKRSKPPNDSKLPNEVSIGDFKYNLIRQELWCGVTRINLTSTQTKLMQIFVNSPNTVISRDELIKNISTVDNNVEQLSNKIRSIDVQINRLREKLELDPRNPGYLKTVRGYGYIFEPD